jgi:hypothetical protein
MARPISRRLFLSNLAATGALIGGNGPAASASRRRPAQQAAIDRAALVDRNSPVLRALDPLSPLSVGNGEFAFTADVTGAQTFASEYRNAMPLCTMSQWGWHMAPLPRGLDKGGLRLTRYDTYGRDVGYATSPEGQSELYTWLRENPHRLHLGQIGFRLLMPGGREATVADISEIEQRLDLWNGVLVSRFRAGGAAVLVNTAVHPGIDLVAITIESQIISEGRLGIRFSFPYGSPAMSAADWEKPAAHSTRAIAQPSEGVMLSRRLDEDEYSVRIEWTGRARFSAGGSEHTYLLEPLGGEGRLEVVAAFSPQPRAYRLPPAAATFRECSVHWNRFWKRGGAIEFTGSSDKRAPELERRMVLSQYLTAIQCSGSKPPQETGLTLNSWYGKFHLEMHWWHAAHFALWNRLSMLERSLGWYEATLPAARALAESQGYRGARWPKMVGPEGRDSPSPIGPLLIWQQPHPIFYAETCYRVRRDRKTLERFRKIVFESAEFMASYAHYEPERMRYVLGPPVIPAQENHPPRETCNPTFELSYWAWGLGVAQQWRRRLGMRPNAEWERVVAALSRLPIKDGVYLAHENCPQTFTERNHDHPSMLGSLGVLPGEGVDRETMRRTLQRVINEWQWERTWGWDYPLTAMTAARLGEPGMAIDALTMAVEKNRYLANGHNWQRPSLPCYLPGNGGLLYALALMAGGWKDGPRGRAPGFPSDGSWSVRAEGLNSPLLRQS